MERSEEVKRESCVVCGIWGFVNGVGMCEGCDEEVRERRLSEKDVNELCVEFLKEFEGYEVGRIEELVRVDW